MNTCSNCGSTLRPGAKFCTTCGTRLNEATPLNDGWNTPRTTPTDDSQETSFLEPVQPADPWKPQSLSGSDNQREYDRWTSAYSSTPDQGNDPASRFISALEDQDTPATSESATDVDEETDTVDPTSTWVTPPPAATSTWSFQGNTAESSEPQPEPQATSDSNDAEDWKAPATWGQVEPEPAVESEVAPEQPVESEAAPDQPDSPQPPAPGEIDIESDFEDEIDAETDAAGFRDGGVDEVDYLSGDENIEVSGQELPVLEPNDARTRAIELVDELRRMVRMMPAGIERDPGAAAMALTEASLNVSDFADVREVLSELQDDPRDIQALSNLARKADKIELLLDEHASLVAAVESALREITE